MEVTFTCCFQWAYVNTATSLNRIVFFICHVSRVKNFEPLQGLEVTLKISFNELFNWNGLKRED